MFPWLEEGLVWIERKLDGKKSMHLKVILKLWYLRLIFKLVIKDVRFPSYVSEITWNLNQS
jgi:hypothetical protein